MSEHDQVANYIGGTESDPCPTGIGFLGSLYCNDNDYRAWRLAAKMLYTQGILPSWEQYVAGLASESAPEDPTAGPLFKRVERYRQTYEKLPDSTLWKTGTSKYVAEAVALMQEGQVVLANVRAASMAIGLTPLDLPTGPRKFPKREGIPWWGWALIVAAGTGAGVAIGMGVKK